MNQSPQLRGGSELSRYLSEIRALPSLSKTEEIERGVRISEGMRECQNELVVSNLGFVVKIASDYQNLGLPLEDLLNEGNLGLIHAAARYDHRKGVKFITYAAWWVRKAILKALADQAPMIRVPVYQRRKLADSSKRPASGPHRLPWCRTVSLDEAGGAEGRRRLIDTLVDQKSQDAEDDLIRREVLTHLDESLGLLNAKERAVIVWRFGLGGERTLTLKEIGEKLGLTRERIRQLEMSARDRLRARLHRLSSRRGAGEAS